MACERALGVRAKDKPRRPKSKLRLQFERNRSDQAIEGSNERELVEVYLAISQYWFHCWQSIQSPKEQSDDGNAPKPQNQLMKSS